jgi:hypothetical protein
MHSEIVLGLRDYEITDIHRGSYGFRNFQNYRLRVKVMCS